MNVLHIDSIYGKKEFETENIDIESIRKMAVYLNPKLLQNKKYEYVYSPEDDSTIRRLQRAKNIILSNKELHNQSDLTKQLFINSFVFPNSLDFIQNITKYHIHMDYIETILNSIEQLKKKNISCARFHLKKLDIIQKHYNLYDLELILNKISEIFYYDSKLIASQKIKK